MSHFILSRTDLSNIAKHHFHVSPDGKRLEERWAPSGELVEKDCFESLRPALLEAIYRPKKAQSERLAEIEVALKNKPFLSGLSPRHRKFREGLVIERSSIWEAQKRSDNLLRKLSQEPDLSDDQISRYAHIFGLDVEIALQRCELQFEGEMLERGTNIYTVTDSLGELSIHSYRVSHHRVLLDEKGHRIMHLCEAQEGTKRGLMVDSAHVPGLRAKQADQDSPGVFFTKAAAVAQARRIQKMRQGALDRMTATIDRFAGVAAAVPTDTSIGRLETAAA